MLRRNVIALYSYLKGGCSEVEFSLLSQVTSERMTGNGLRLHQAKFSLHISKNFVTKRMVLHWKRLPREVVESSSLEISKRHADVTLRDTVHWRTLQC